jgi:hypothetical protein
MYPEYHILVLQKRRYLDALNGSWILTPNRITSSQVAQHHTKKQLSSAVEATRG